MHRHKRSGLLTVSTLLVLAASITHGYPGPRIAAAQAETAIALQNPAFDPPWSKRADVCGSGVTLEEVQVPQGWEPYWACQSPSDEPNINRTPEYRMVDMAFPYRVRSANTALRYFNFWALNRSAGVYQVVQGIRPGTRLRFSLWVQLWTSQADIDPPQSIEPGNLEARVCIDALGRNQTPNPADPAITCSEWARPWDRYEQLSVEATAAAPAVTVILNTRAEFAVKHNDVMADDASLVMLSITPATPPVTARPTTIPREVIDIAPVLRPNASNSTQPTLLTTEPTGIFVSTSANARVLRRLARGVTIKARGLSADKQWWRVVSGNAGQPLGWTPVSAVAPNALAEALLQQESAVVVTLTGAPRLRAAPRTSAPQLVVLPADLTLPVLAKSSDGLWWQVRYDAAPGGAGWVRALSVSASALADGVPAAP